MKYTPLFLFLTLSTTACQENFDKRLAREAREFTELHCPQSPEPGTQLDSATYAPELHTYTQWFTLTAENVQALKAAQTDMRKLLVQSVIGNVDFAEVKRHQVAFRFVYREARTGQIIFDTTVKPADYNR